MSKRLPLSHRWQLLKQAVAPQLAQMWPGITLIGLVALARLLGLLQPLEWTALDNLMRWRAPEAPEPRVLIVGITEADIRRVGRYPIPDRELAALLRRLQQYQPRAIGLDLVRDLVVEPGHRELVEAFRANQNLLAVERTFADRSGAVVKPPPSLPPERVCLADVYLDADGHLRRILLGAWTARGYQFSLSLCLAAQYLEREQIFLENGTRDLSAIRFGAVELPRALPNSGGYVRAAGDENQTLLNFRSGRQPFRVVSLTEIEQGRVEPGWIRDRIVIIGVTAPSVQDTVNTAAIAGVNPGQAYGVEIHAHAASQILSAVLDRRPLLRDWSEGWEYLWLVGWGLVGIGLSQGIASPLKLLLALGLAGAGLGVASYGALLVGWWLPVVPALLALVLNGTLFASFYRYDQSLKSQIAASQLGMQERQQVIDHTFDAIHNGPLQTLAQMLKAAQAQEAAPNTWFAKLKHLDEELRAVYEAVGKEVATHSQSLYLGSNLAIDLAAPVDKLLSQAYRNALARDLPCFKTLEVKVYQFEPLRNCVLSFEQKRGLYRFLEEALCNVGKHATGVTCLRVIGAQEQGWYRLRVMDNGAGLPPQTQAGVATAQRIGTQQAENLAQQLGGRFRRAPQPPQGTLCELSWPVSRAWRWRPSRWW